MPNWAVLNENNDIVNTIVAETEEIARLVSNNATCVQFTDDDHVSIGGKYLGKGKFELPEELKPKKLTVEEMIEIAKANKIA